MDTQATMDMLLAMWTRLEWQAVMTTKKKCPVVEWQYQDRTCICVARERERERSGAQTAAVESFQFIVTSLLLMASRQDETLTYSIARRPARRPPTVDHPLTDAVTENDEARGGKLPDD